VSLECISEEIEDLSSLVSQWDWSVEQDKFVYGYSNDSSDMFGHNIWLVYNQNMLEDSLVVSHSNDNILKLVH